MLNDPKASSASIRKYYIVFGALVLFIVVLIGFSLLQSRGKILDNEIANRLADVWYDIEYKQYGSGGLPVSLNKATNRNTKDLTYYRLDERTYMLCAEFETKSGTTKPDALNDRQRALIEDAGQSLTATTYHSSKSDNYGYVDIYVRQEGRNCYINELEILPDDSLKLNNYENYESEDANLPSSEI